MCIFSYLKSVLRYTFLILHTCRLGAVYLYISMNKDVRICGYFSKPTGIRNHKSMGDTAIYCLILLKFVPFRLVSIFLITFSGTVFNSVVDSASQASYYATCFSQLSLNFHFSTKYCSVIFIKLTNFFGIPNSFKVSYKYVLFIDL